MTFAARPVRRETAQVYRGRPLVVTVHAGYLEIREKGRRDALTVDYATVYEFAMKLRWKRQQAEKRSARRAK